MNHNNYTDMNYINNSFLIKHDTDNNTNVKYYLKSNRKKSIYYILLTKITDIRLISCGKHKSIRELLIPSVYVPKKKCSCFLEQIQYCLSFTPLTILLYGLCYIWVDKYSI